MVATYFVQIGYLTSSGNPARKASLPDPKDGREHERVRQEMELIIDEKGKAKQEILSFMRNQIIQLKTSSLLGWKYKPADEN